MDLSKLTSTPVLVLNASYEPIQIQSARNAIKLIVKGVARIEEHRDREFYPGFLLPSVVRLTTYRKIPTRMQVLTRKNIYLRDRQTCQYCGKKFPVSELTLDHIIPQSKGGPSTWNNLVTCCRADNLRKGHKTLKEAESELGMRLLRVPKPLTVHTAKSIIRTIGEDDPKWRKYLYYENMTPQEN
jgi:5-methylcytosine-specific restriction endonuclease McrA